MFRYSEFGRVENNFRLGIVASGQFTAIDGRSGRML